MKLKSNFKNMVLVLTVITLVAAGAVGSVYSLTETPIAQAKQAKQEAAIKEVLPPFDKLDEPETTNDITIIRAYNGGQFVGAAVEAGSRNGFSGAIKIMVGFDVEGTIVNYAVLQQAETPGLGTKMVDWFKTDKNRQNIKGLNPATANLTVSKDGGDIDAITASTISSRAFLEAVRAAYAAYSNTPDAHSGASAVVAKEVAEEKEEPINLENAE